MFLIFKLLSYSILFTETVSLIVIYWDYIDEEMWILHVLLKPMEEKQISLCITRYEGNFLGEV